METEPTVRRPGLVAALSLARLLHDKGERWEIERVERGTEWVAVLRATGSGDYIRIVGGQDLGALRFKMNEVEHDQAQERAPDGAEERSA
jgi:hypothetical protein